MENHRSAAAIFDLTDNVALVTGGSRGLGREMVLAFAEAGADVVIASRKLAACEELAHQVRETTGRRALAVACHVAYWDDIDRMVDTVYEHFGRVDVLVNNAGMSPLYEDVSNVGEDLYDKVFGVNLKGPFRLMAQVGSRMAAGDGGSILNISSIGAVHPNKDVIPYAAAKVGLNSMTASFAQAFGPSVRVNAIMPGGFFTDVSAAWDREAFDAHAARTFALGRGGEPHEIVGAALYFASDASSYTTGAVLAVDGGVPA
ncbi:glucose 1-dehydrogenase [Yinghuangia sp. ASG 101]|uniref:SDR family NAD(P)-dependent oxidoreductase n=1 Tax=Yinghuangia sp. ASG 101 TaxID=2896848 RepID=UPI001E58CC54|nr:glucose 1-dehydrogenase [Yinghuangia sp. ASG 101]UGQ11199.1 glucose 1-dehydrogenase [Yinghuangia sp. ASG 101]